MNLDKHKRYLFTAWNSDRKITLECKCFECTPQTLYVAWGLITIYKNTYI